MEAHRGTKGFAPVLAGTKRVRKPSAVAAEADADAADAACAVVTAAEEPSAKAPPAAKTPRKPFRAAPVAVRVKKSVPAAKLVKAGNKSAAPPRKQPLALAPIPAVFATLPPLSKEFGARVKAASRRLPELEDDGADLVYASGGMGPSGPWIKWGPASGR